MRPGTLEAARAFRPDTAGAEEEGRLVNTDVQAMNKRHEIHLSRVAGDGRKTGWRPTKRFRRHAEDFVDMLDNQFDVSTYTKGLRFFQWQPSNPVWNSANWRRWPTITGSVDQGSDVLAGSHATLRFLHLNIMWVYDFRHGVARDLLGVWKLVGKMSFVILMLIIYNLPHGPQQEEGLRYSQLLELMEWMFEKAGTE